MYYRIPWSHACVVRCSPLLDAKVRFVLRCPLAIEMIRCMCCFDVVPSKVEIDFEFEYYRLLTAVFEFKFLMRMLMPQVLIPSFDVQY